MTILQPIRLDDEWNYPLHLTGHISTLPPEPEDDLVRQLHDVVREITGKPVDVPQRARIGFLP